MIFWIWFLGWTVSGLGWQDQKNMCWSQIGSQIRFKQNMYFKIWTRTNFLTCLRIKLSQNYLLTLPICFKDPSHLISESGIKKMKLRRRKACLEDHKVKTRKLIGLQVITIYTHVQPGRQVFSTLFLSLKRRHSFCYYLMT